MRKKYEYHIDDFSFEDQHLGHCLYCDRANSFGTYSRPSCQKNRAKKRVIIDHEPDMEGIGEEELLLCNDCAKQIRKDAERHGYKVTVHTLTKKEIKKIIEHYTS